MNSANRPPSPVQRRLLRHPRRHTIARAQWHPRHRRERDAHGCLELVEVCNAHRSLPSTIESEKFVSWLLEFGRKNPGYVLYPTSDDVTYLYTLHKSELRAALSSLPS